MVDRKFFLSTAPLRMSRLMSDSAARKL